ncbi:MAG: PmoA family protein [Planctomycetes bacterium]|nr:PmoA family protein [Planctomycetota bacterium]
MRRLALGLLLPLCCPLLASAQEVTWQRDDHSLSLRRTDQELWTLRFDPAQPHTFFHPLALPGCGPLTVDSPADHVWHHGLWFSWKYLNGVNYWEHERDTGRPAGTTHFEPPTIVTADDGSATVGMLLTYAPKDAEPVLRERRVLHMSAPGPDGAFAIDWSAHSTVLADELRFERTPLPGEPRGQVFGGYAGLSLRLVNLDDRDVVAALDEQPEFNAQDRLRCRAPALEYHGRLGEREVGIAVLAHPANVNSPSPWYAIRSPAMTFFTPAVICYEPLTLARGAELTLRYRILVHLGHWDADRLRAEHARYVAETPNPQPENHR